MPKKLITAAEAAERLGITVDWFRVRAKAIGLKPVETRKTGKRGRPAHLFALDQLSAVTTK